MKSLRIQGSNRAVRSALLLAVIAFPGSAHALTHDQLRATAHDAVVKRLVTVDRPHFNGEGRELQYYVGGIGPFLAEQIYNPLLGSTITNQIQVEVLRDFLNDAARGRGGASSQSLNRLYRDKAFWDQMFGEIETIIRRQLTLVDGSPDTAESRTMQHEELSQKIWETMQVAFDKEAKRLNFDVAVPMAAGAGAKSVTLKTNPPGGKIFLMHAIEQDLARLEGRAPRWTNVKDEDSLMVDGVYWYSLQFGGQVGTPPKQIDFGRNEEQLEYTLR
jgi:hypothetical protein